MTVFATGARARTADFEAGDVGYVQQTLPHYIENTGDTDLRFLEMFKSSFYQDLALSEWLRQGWKACWDDHQIGGEPIARTPPSRLQTRSVIRQLKCSGLVFSR